jgi:hypothetical protein
MSRLGADPTDQTQRTVSNTRFANYSLSNYFSQIPSAGHVQFAIQQPTMNYSGIAYGSGLTGSLVDTDSLLTIKADQERPLEKLQLFSRPFATVPYLGRGSCDPAIESQLQQGELVHDKKSVSTIMEKSFGAYSLYPLDDQMQTSSKDASNRVEELAMNGWVRGGASTRELVENNRPSAKY